MLQSLSDQLARSALKRHALFLAAACCTILFIGYHFGTFDQAVHIPFLKKYADPSLFPGDPFFEMRFKHYSYFWYPFIFLYKLGALEVSMFLVHVLATYLTFWGLWALSDALFHNPLASLLGILAFVFPHVGFAGFPVLEFSLLNRTFVFPFLLWAITLYLRRRYLAAFALLGALFNLHVVSVNFVMAMLLLDSVLQIRAIGWKNLLGGLGLFVLFASPVLVWRAGAPPTPALQADWFTIVSRAFFYNLFYLLGPYPHIVMGTLSGVGAFALFGIARHYAPLPASDRAVTNFMYAILLILAVQIITANWIHITLIQQLQIIRAGIFALLFAYLYFAHYLARQYQAGALRGGDFGWLVASLLGTVLTLVPLAAWALHRRIASARWRQGALAALLVAFGVLTLWLSAQYGLWSPGLHIFGPRNAWIEVQAWARDNTPKDALFVTPPHRWSFYDSGWHVFSERSTVVTLADLLEIALVPDNIDVWNERFEQLAPGALSRFGGDFFENMRITAEAFYSLTPGELLRIASRYGATYLVVEKPHSHALPLVYENDHYLVYKLTP
ncbi:MAG: hypothetical protein JW850_00915 [Thermoflexales bacterium]|nr:hypothetical protein [Thermoflexales bacterium]